MVAATALSRPNGHTPASLLAPLPLTLPARCRIPPPRRCKQCQTCESGARGKRALVVVRSCRRWWPRSSLPSTHPRPPASLARQCRLGQRRHWRGVPRLWSHQGLHLRQVPAPGGRARGSLGGTGGRPRRRTGPAPEQAAWDTHRPPRRQPHSGGSPRAPPTETLLPRLPGCRARTPSGASPATATTPPAASRCAREGRAHSAHLGCPCFCMRGARCGRRRGQRWAPSQLAIAPSHDPILLPTKY